MTGPRGRLFGVALVLLGAALAVVAVIGPLVLGALRYRTSPTTLNQIMGGDAAALAVVAPVSIVAGILALRGHPAAPVLGLPPAVFAVYTYAQLIVGNEYLRLPGNVERFFPLLLAVFMLAGGIAVRAWSSVSASALPPPSGRMSRVVAVLLLGVAGFVVLGLHLPTYLDAIRADPTGVQYVSSPTAFWVVKFMDLGVVAPAAVAVGVGVIRGRAWARKAAYLLVGGYALLGASVAGMALTMYLNDDPDASFGLLVASTVVAAALAAVAVQLYRPLLRPATLHMPLVRGRTGHPAEVSAERACR